LHHGEKKQQQGKDTFSTGQFHINNQKKMDKQSSQSRVKALPMK
jgi:hypothetical protein